MDLSVVVGAVNILRPDVCRSFRIGVMCSHFGCYIDFLFGAFQWISLTELLFHFKQNENLTIKILQIENNFHSS